MSRIRRGPMRPGFEPYQDRSGQVVATSNEAFVSRAGCLRAIRAVRTIIGSLP